MNCAQEKAKSVDHKTIYYKTFMSLWGIKEAICFEFSLNDATTYVYTAIMRVLGFAFLVAMFFANTIIVSAWAKPCLNGGAMDTSMHSEMIMNHNEMGMSNMPCEDMHQNQEQNDKQHCDGVCLCFHTCASQSLMVNEPTSLGSSVLFTLAYNISDDRFINISTSALKRPPRA